MARYWIGLVNNTPAKNDILITHVLGLILVRFHDTCALMWHTDRVCHVELFFFAPGYTVSMTRTDILQS